MTDANPSYQLLILARLGEFCQYRAATQSREADGWGYMLRKIKETEEPLANLKAELFQATQKRLLEEMRSEKMTDERYADFKVLFERLLSPGDFADLAIHLRTDGAEQAHRLRAVTELIGRIKPHHLFIEESKTPDQRSPSWEKLINELHARLDLDRMTLVMNRKPRSGRKPAPFSRRKSAVLRRLRRNVLEYCTVIRIPTSPTDTFTPFMLPRIEALIAASLRFLSKYR